MAVEMLEGLYMYENSPALFLYPWVLAWLVWVKSSGSQSKQIPFDIPVVCLNDFSHPDKIPGKDCPFAIDGERYYFTKQVPRDRRSKGKAGNRSERKAGKEGAYWKSTSKDIEITDLNRKLIGYMRKYTLYEATDKKRSTNWHMEEYRALADGPVDEYVLCKIYDKDSCCPKYTDTSIRALTKRIIERQRGSYPDQTNSLFDSGNLSQNPHWTSQKDSNRQPTFPPESFLTNPGLPSYSNEHAGCSNSLSMSHEDPSMQPPLPTSAHRKKKLKTTLPTSENFPPESLLPTSGPPSETKVFLMPHCLSNEFSMSRDPLGNLNPPESVRQIPGPPDYGFSMSHDLSGNLNPPIENFPPESFLPNPGPPSYNNDYAGFSNSHLMSHQDFSMQPPLPTSENFPPESLLPTSEPPSVSKVFPMFHCLPNDCSMSRYPSGNLNPSESTLLIPGYSCYSSEFPMRGTISNDLSMPCDLSGNVNPPESTLLNPERPCYSNEFSMCGVISNELSMSHEDLSMQPPLPTSAHRKKKLKTTLPTSENFPPESLLPTSEPPNVSKVFPMLQCLPNECSMSRHPSGNLNPPESIRPIPGPPDYSNGFSMSHDLTGNLNPSESTLLIPGNSCYSNEFPMCGTISNDLSMPCDLSGNVNPPESSLLNPERPCYSNEFSVCGVSSNEFSMSQDSSGNPRSPDGEESPLECSSQLWNH